MPEGFCGQISDKYSNQPSANDIQWIMHPYIHLRVRDKEGPQKEYHWPFFKPVPQGEVQESGHAKMSGSMGRGKAGALWPVPNQHAYPVGNGRFVAGPDADDVVLDEVAAHIIGEGGRSDTEKNPPESVLRVIKDHEQKKEQVQRRPQVGIAEPGHHPVEKTILPIQVDVPEQLPIVGK